MEVSETPGPRHASTNPNIGASRMTNTILGVPYYNRSIMAPKPYSGGPDHGQARVAGSPGGCWEGRKLGLGTFPLRDDGFAEMQR